MVTWIKSENREGISSRRSDIELYDSGRDGKQGTNSACCQMKKYSTIVVNVGCVEKPVPLLHGFDNKSKKRH